MNPVLLVAVAEEQEPARAFVHPGWETLLLPCLQAHERLLEPAELDLLRTAPGLVVTSPRAARWLTTHLPAFTGTIAVAGPSTARLLARPGIRILEPACSGGEGAARAWMEAGIAGCPVFLAGDETAGTVESTLKAGGIDFARVVAYRMEPRPCAFSSVPWERVRALYLTSGAVARSFLGQLPGAAAQACREGRVAFAAQGATVLRALEESGWRMACPVVPRTAQDLGEFLARAG